MRKSIIAKQVRYYYDMLYLETRDVNNGGNVYTVISNWRQVNDALYKLNEFDFIGNSIQDIFNLGASFQASVDNISVLKVEYPKFETKFNLVKAKCEAIIDLCEEVDDKNDLYIKLPSNLNDLDKLSKIVAKLDVSLNKCPILCDEIGHFQFKKVEEGSCWVVIALTIGTIGSITKALNWIAEFISKCNEIRLQNITIKNLEFDNILKEIEIDEKKRNEYKLKYEQVEEEKIKETCLKMFEGLDTNKNKLSNEDKSRIVHCMKTMADLLDEGIEIYPSIDVEEETKNLFPKREDLKLCNEEQKLLDNKSDNSRKD